MPEMPLRIVILTGISGSGKATALHIFEDAGYFAVDCLPPQLLPELAAEAAGNARPRVVAVVDSRSGESIAELPDRIVALKREGHIVEVVFLEATDESLVRRFKETRRPHPSFNTGHGTILDAIRQERGLLADVRAVADRIVDTTGLSPAELRDKLVPALATTTGGTLRITIESFGFKHGLPTDADLVFDVRFLRNPHYVHDLKPLTGISREVSAYVHADPLTQPFFERMLELIAFSLPHYAREGKAYLTIAIGCTGGRHRSVTIAEDLATPLRNLGYPVTVYHRDAHQPPITPREPEVEP